MSLVAPAVQLCHQLVGVRVGGDRVKRHEAVLLSSSASTKQGTVLLFIYCTTACERLLHPDSTRINWSTLRVSLVFFCLHGC